MAVQLDKRARQLAAQKGRSYDDALRHLLDLMKQGWSAQGKGLWICDLRFTIDAMNQLPAVKASS